MRGEWCYFKSYISKDTCENIINLSKDMPVDKASIGLEKNNNVKFVNIGNWKFKETFDALWKTQIQANQDFFNFHISRLDRFHITEHNQSYHDYTKPRSDMIWLNNDPYYHRKLSCIIQLSDPKDYDGGQVEITDAVFPPSKEELNQQGTIIFFPTILRHMVQPVTRGTRYSIVAWFEGPKWR